MCELFSNCDDHGNFKNVDENEEKPHLFTVRGKDLRDFKKPEKHKHFSFG